VGSGGDFQQLFSIGAKVDDAQQRQGESAGVASITVDLVKFQVAIPATYPPDNVKPKPS
jgi:hypothetical protein